VLIETVGEPDRENRAYFRFGISVVGGCNDGESLRLRTFRKDGRRLQRHAGMLGPILCNERGQRLPATLPRTREHAHADVRRSARRVVADRLDDGRSGQFVRPCRTEHNEERDPDPPSHTPSIEACGLPGTA